ncbi:4-hydroxy-tetrahydrodipicolinate synthase [Salinicoccus kekensis]|uniref:4-hydroxy-tetrahydrodipicolinate synthase n=1 Tax=Salinicoccus kekensis TaxID=714307 RepID=A0A285UAL9_9STAP|nr:4-hydroxy-tetrahydrodipicolinate synthase [Salinicoccus kekensis]SOC38965.1 4-hydroxy-tetrahydrodipicolinate synthase [Salinicoccus kekensis]
MNPIFEGIGVAMTTPFNDNEVDYDAFRRHIEYLIENDAQALIVNGTTGESPTLSAEEIETLIKVGIDTVAGRVPVIAGTGTNSTMSSIELSRYAEEAGADGVMLITPYYNKANQKGLIAHFTAIADAIDIPVILYNVPGRTGMTIEPETVVELSRHSNIVALKDAVGDLNYTIKLMNMIDQEEFVLYSGNDDNFADFIQLGGKGLISVVGNVIPGELQSIYSRLTEGDYNAKHTFTGLMPLIEAVQVDVNPIPIKALTSELGFGNYELRLPLLPAEEEMRAEIVKAYEAFKEGSKV